jgi:homoserine kinase type II
MPPETELRLDDLARLLAPFDLRPRRARSLEQGTVNSNFRVETDGGPLFVRVNEGKSEADVRFEAALLWHLGARRIPTPQPLRSSTGRPYVLHDAKCVTAFPWTPGTLVDGARITPEHAGQVGLALARLHKDAADFRERRDGIYTFAEIVKRIERLRGQSQAVSIDAGRRARMDVAAGALPLFDDEVAWLRDHRAPALPSVTIHGDLFPDNVLWRGRLIAALLDFEQASFGRLAYDFAVALLAWCWSGEGELDRERARAFATGYQRLRALEPVERDGLWAEARLAALRFTVTRITDVFLPGVGRPGKDFHDYLARLHWLRETGAAGLAATIETETKSAT